MPALRFSRNTALLTILLATIWFAIPKATVAQDRAKVNKLLAKLTDNLPDSTRYLYLSRLAAQYWYTNMDTALLYANKALLVAKQSRSEALLAKAYQLFGSIYSDFDPGKAIGYIYKALPMCERLGNEQGIMICYNDLGLCFMVLDKKEQAEQMFDKALVYAYKLRRTYHVSYLVGNKGRMQFEQNKYDSAMLCFRLACKLDLQNVDSLSYGQNLINIGSVYAAQNELEKALEYIGRGVDLCSKSNDLSYACTGYYQLSVLYFRRKLLVNAVKYGTLALANATESDNAVVRQKASNLLSQIFRAKNDFRRSLGYFELYSQIHDSIFNLRQSQLMLNEKAQYDIERSNIRIEILEANTKRAELLFFVQTGSLALLLVFALFIWFSRKRLQTAYRKLNVQTIKVTAQHREIEQKNLVVISQHRKLTEGINYAKMIQDAILPSAEVISENIPNHFLFYLPRDVVSGDFYWLHKLGDSLYFAVVDCTGHGVPGAMMSMLATALLNEAMATLGEASPAAIMEHLRSKVKHTLKQDGQAGRMNDGMDMSLCKINIADRTVVFSGAYHSMFVARNAAAECEFVYDRAMLRQASDATSIYEIRGDKQPVSAHLREIAFRNHHLSLLSGDCFYLGSDGFISQFGGERNEKYGVKRLCCLLHDISLLPIELQRIRIGEAFLNWKKAEIQMDDILLFACKL